MTRGSVLLPSSVVAGDSVTLTSSIFITSEVEVTTTSESATSSHITPIQTASSEGTTIPTLTVGYGTSGEIETTNLSFDNTSSGTSTQTVVYKTSEEIKTLSGFYWQTPAPTELNPGYYNSCVNESANNYFFFKHRSTIDGSSTFAIVIGALAATVLLLMCVIGLLCVKHCFSYFSFKNTG